MFAAFHWEVLIVPAIALVVWIVTTVLRGGDDAPKPPRYVDPEDRRPRRAPTNIERTADEPRRREPPVRRAAKRPVVLEEVKETPQTSLQSTRAGYAPTQSPSKAPVEKPLPPLAEGPPQTSLQSTRAGYAPTQSPSKSVDEKPLPSSPVLVQVRELLRSPKGAAAAFVLREILDAPRCRRPQ